MKIRERFIDSRVNSDSVRVLRNAFYLFLVQGTNYLSPLIILGYLLKTLTEHGFGVYAFTLSIVLYLQTIFDYGFLLTGSRDIAQNRSNKKKVSQIFWSISLAKFLISFIFLIFLSIAYSISFFDQDFNLIFFAFLLAFFNSFIPIWYFHGTENFRFIAIFNGVGKILGCIFVIYFVKSDKDIAFIFLVQVLPSFIVSLIAYYFIFKLGEIDKCKIKWVDIVDQYKNGWHIFTATLSSAILSNGGVFWLGLQTSPVILGSYAAIESIIKAIVTVFQPINRAIYPVAASAFSRNFKHGLSTVKKFGSWILVGSAVLSLLVMIILPFFLKWINYENIPVVLIFILAPWIFFGVLNNILGIQLLTAAGYESKYSYSFHISALFFVVMLFFLTKEYDGIGVALSLTVSEVLLSLILFSKVKNIINSNVLIK